MMRQVIVNCLFYFVDIASLTLCSWYPVSLMVGGKKFVQNSKILRDKDCGVAGICSVDSNASNARTQ